MWAAGSDQAHELVLGVGYEYLRRKVTVVGVHNHLFASLGISV